MARHRYRNRRVSRELERSHLLLPRRTETVILSGKIFPEPGWRWAAAKASNGADPVGRIISTAGRARLPRRHISGPRPHMDLPCHGDGRSRRWTLELL